MLAIVDTHLLIASADKQSFPPVSRAAPEDLASAPDQTKVVSALAAGALAGAVLVQRGKTYGYDNSLILSAANTDPRLRAICAVDGRREDCGNTASELLASPNVAGLRLMEPEKGANLDWLSGPGALAAWRTAADRQSIMDVHVFPWNRAAALGVLEKLLGEFPGVRVLLDNLGNIPLEEGAPGFGVDAMLRKVAERERVTLKVSTMSFARLRKAGQDPAEAVAAIVQQFGAACLCWGSDVLAPGVSLEDACEEARIVTSALNEGDAELVLCGNAKRLFALP